MWAFCFVLTELQVSIFQKMITIATRETVRRAARKVL
jgi:hypothetical protein